MKIHTLFAGSVLRPEDVPGLVVVILLYATPAILFVVTLVMLIIDMVKRKLRTATKILILLTIISGGILAIAVNVGRSNL